MDIIRKKQKAEQGQDWLHCPVCKERRQHYRRISGGMEVWTCTRCQNVQSYVYQGGECEDDE